MDFRFLRHYLTSEAISTGCAEVAVSKSFTQRLRNDGVSPRALRTNEGSTALPVAKRPLFLGDRDPRICGKRRSVRHHRLTEADCSSRLDELSITLTRETRRQCR